MIDNKKIEDAAKLHSEESYISSYFQACYKDAFMECAKWIQEEFVKELGHTTSEEPKENFDLVYINNTKEFREISSYNSDRFDDLFGKGWEAACRMFGIYKWAYKDDLLPKKGGEQ